MKKIPKIAIVVIAYNRPDALNRILGSLAKASYEEYSGIPLVISIDKSDSAGVLTVAESFNWQFGEKKIIAHKENLGLRKHVISCGDLVYEYENIIVLEDDLFVSPFFFDYANQALEFYNEDERIGGISLYSYDYNELLKQPWIPVNDGYDNYFMQVPSSWGQLWTKKQWNDFKLFYMSASNEIGSLDNMPAGIIGWPDTSWKKYFFKYLVSENKYFVYPQISLTTNCGEVGAHFGQKVNTFQVRLSVGKRNFSFSSFDISLAKYDSYQEILPEVIKHFNEKLSNFDFECDLTGIKELNKIKSKYLLSIKDCSSPLLSFSGGMIPFEMNVFLNQTGNIFSFAETTNFASFDRQKMLQNTYHSKINISELRQVVYEIAENNMAQTISYKLGSALLWPFKLVKKLLK